jgi:hypothetical protein
LFVFFDLGFFCFRVDKAFPVQNQQRKEAESIQEHDQIGNKELQKPIFASNEPLVPDKSRKVAQLKEKED